LTSCESVSISRRTLQHGVSQSISQSVNQSVSQSISQSVHQSIIQSVSHSVSQLAVLKEAEMGHLYFMWLRNSASSSALMFIFLPIHCSTNVLLLVNAGTKL